MGHGFAHISISDLIALTRSTAGSVRLTVLGSRHARVPGRVSSAATMEYWDRLASTIRRH